MLFISGPLSKYILKLEVPIVSVQCGNISQVFAWLYSGTCLMCSHIVDLCTRVTSIAAISLTCVLRSPLLQPPGWVTNRLIL